MGGSALTYADASPQRSLSEQFDEVFPYYLSIGMSYDQFWNDRPELAVAYRKADRLTMRRTNENAWLQGAYFNNALNAVIGNAFGKGRKKEYPRSPLPIFEDELRERRVSEQQVKTDKAKAGMMAFAQKFNAKFAAQAAPPQEVVTGGNRN